MGKSVFAEFMDLKLSEHVEPVRKGVAKGHPIGFPRTKLLACLFCLIRATDRERAKELKISASMLRKWRTEAAFKATVEALEKEYVAFFMERCERGDRPTDKFAGPYSKTLTTNLIPVLGAAANERKEMWPFVYGVLKAIDPRPVSSRQTKADRLLQRLEGLAVVKIERGLIGAFQGSLAEGKLTEEGLMGLDMYLGFRAARLDDQLKKADSVIEEAEGHEKKRLQKLVRAITEAVGNAPEENIRRAKKQHRKDKGQCRKQR